MVGSAFRPFRRTSHWTPLGHAPRLLRAASLAGAVATAAVVLLSGCSGANDNVPSPVSSTSTPSASPTATMSASAAASSTAESTVDAIVQGFPVKLIPAMKGATVTSTSFDRTAPLSSASMTATVKATSAAVLAYYTKIFTDQGFAAQPGDAVGGVPSKTFIRANGQEIITVSIVQSGPVAAITIGANVLPASLK